MVLLLNTHCYQSLGYSSRWTCSLLRDVFIPFNNRLIEYRVFLCFCEKTTKRFSMFSPSNNPTLTNTKETALTSCDFSLSRQKIVENQRFRKFAYVIRLINTSILFQLAVTRLTFWTFCGSELCKRIRKLFTACFPKTIGGWLKCTALCWVMCQCYGWLCFRLLWL